MRLFAFFLICGLFGADASAQTLKSLMYNTTNGRVAFNNANDLTFVAATNGSFSAAKFLHEDTGQAMQIILTDETMSSGYNAVSGSIGVGGGVFEIKYGAGSTSWARPLLIKEDTGSSIWETVTNHFPVQEFRFSAPITFNNSTNAAITRTNLGLGSTNSATFGQLTVSNATFYVTKTNVGPFEGLANLMSPSNVTLSNETLFRVGRAEATNQSAQFGFRIVRTNNGGEGFAVFSVYGYNALMMIGPSDRSRTNTATNAAIEADIWTINQTNRVMTLRDTNTGALTLHQDIGFNAALTNNAPSNTTTPAAWMRVWVGTNSYRLPIYQ